MERRRWSSSGASTPFRCTLELMRLEANGVRRRSPLAHGFGFATSSPYPVGPSGIRRSVEEVVRLIRLGYSTPQDAAQIRGWLGRALIAAGRPQGAQAQTQALKNALESQSMYLSDPHGMEWIASAASTLCLKPDHCLPAGDCDDLTVALATITLLAGIPTKLVKQSFGYGRQQHILIAIEDERGVWQRVDPSIAGSKVGSAVKAREEVWIDPLADLAPQIVGIGRSSSEPAWHYERAHGKTWATLDGAQWVEVGLGAGDPATPYQPIALPAHVKMGLRYRVTFLVSTLGTDLRIRAFESYAGRGAASDYLRLFFLPDWMVETIAPTGNVTGGIQSWQFIGLPKTAAILGDDAFITYTKVEAQTSPPSAVAPMAPVLPAPPTPNPTSGVSIGEVVAWTLGVGAVGGVGWYMWKHSRRGGAMSRSRGAR